VLTLCLCLVLAPSYTLVPSLAHVGWLNHSWLYYWPPGHRDSTTQYPLLVLVNLQLRSHVGNTFQFLHTVIDFGFVSFLILLKLIIVTVLCIIGVSFFLDQQVSLS